MDTPKFKRVLLKVSGEALAGGAGRGLDFDVINDVAKAIKTSLFSLCHFPASLAANDNHVTHF